MYISLSGFEALESLADLKPCVTDVFTWMTNSKLKAKSKFIIIGSKKQRQKFKDLFPILLLDHNTLPKAFIRNLGFIFIVILTSNDKSLRRGNYASITSVTFGALGSTSYSSHLDYCNSLLYNLPDRDIERLQPVRYCLARLVCKASRFSRSKPLLNFLHWLPVKYRIRFKHCTITYKALLFHQPTYLFNY